MADTPQGDPVTPAPLETNATPPTTPAAAPVNVVDQAEVERLRKEAEQARMRAQQLENEKKARDEADAAARQKQLEEQAQWKTIAEEAQAKAETLEREKTETARQVELTAASQDVLKDYPESVQKVAQTAGLSLLDNSDTATTDFKAKLDAIKAEIGGAAPTVNANNPPATPATPAGLEAKTAEDRARLVTRSAPGEPSPMALAAAKGDDSVLRAYVKDLPAVQRMREISQGM